MIHLSKYARMPIEEILVEHWIVVAEVLCESAQPRGRDLLQRGLVRLVTHPAAVQDATVLSVHLV